MLDNGYIIITVAFIVSFVIIYAILRKRNGRIYPRDIFYVGHVFFLSILLFAAYTAIYLAVTFKENRVSFDKDKWNADIEQRSGMVDDLVRKKILDPLDTNDIIGLLGDPMRKYEDSTGIRYAYYLGFRNRALAVDPEFLIVTFNKKAVGKYYIKEGVPY
jgi:hypothetical protein